MVKEFNQEKIDECNSFTCWCKRTNDDLLEYNKIRDMYVQNRKTLKVINKQEKKKNLKRNKKLLKLKKLDFHQQ